MRSFLRVMVGCAVALLPHAIMAQQRDHAELVPGDTAPALLLNDLDGHPVRLSDYAGHPILLDFWASWCPPCKEETPLIAAAWVAHHDSGLVILGINLRHQESSMRQVRRFLNDFPMPFSVLLDDKGKAQRDYALGLLPVLVFIG